jgi:hypothetical protein
MVTGKSFRGLRIVVLVASLGASAAAAQDGPAGLSVEPFLIYPGIDLGVGYDDNLYSSEINKRSSSFLLVSPYVRLEAKPEPHRFDLSVSYNAARYSRTSADDYDDYRIAANGLAVFNARTDLRAHAEYFYGHDARGSTDRPSGDSPDEFVNSGAEATFGYGAPGARGRLEVNGGFYTREYQTNREFTQASDHDTSIAGGTFFWRVAPKSQLLFQAERRYFEYPLQSSTLDSHETRVYVGARWDATALTSGSAKLGWLKKDFDHDPRQDFSTGSWEVAVRWSPLTYSFFDLSTSRQTNESTGVGDTIVTSRVAVVWTHSWSSRVRSQVLGSWTSDDFRGEGVTREDGTGSLGLRLNYQFRRWLRFAAEYTYTDRDSNDPVVVYQRNLILFTIGATL